MSSYQSSDEQLRAAFASPHTQLPFTPLQRSLDHDAFASIFNLPSTHAAIVPHLPFPHHASASTTTALPTLPADQLGYALPGHSTIVADFANYCFSPFDGADDDSGESFTSSSTASSSAPSSVPLFLHQQTSAFEITSMSSSHAVRSSLPPLPAPPPPARPSSAKPPASTPISSLRSSAQSRSTSSHSASGRVAPKKQRPAALTEDERLQRRRAQHRQVDTARRLKENDAIAKLGTLVAQQKELNQTLAGTEADALPAAEESASDEEEGGRRKAGRLTVLESTVALVEQLTAACQQMAAANNAREAQVHRVSSHLHSVAASIAQQAAAAQLMAVDSAQPEPYSAAVIPSSNNISSGSQIELPPSVSAFLAHSDRSATLRRGQCVTFSTLCALVVASPLVGLIVDVNERLLAASGWQRHELLYTCFEEDNNQSLPLTPLSQHRQPSKGGRRLLQQYPASTARVEAMKRGERRKADALWRAYMRDGKVFEFESTLWAEWDEPLVKARVPDRIVVVFSLDDAVQVDDNLDTAEDVHRH